MTSLRVLVLGTGAVGAGVAEVARRHGFDVTATGRGPASAALRARLLDPLGIAYVTLDLDAEDAGAGLRDLLAAHDLTIVACEPWRAGGPSPTEGVRRLYEAAWHAGYRADRRRARDDPPRRVVRVGSCVAELPRALVDRPGPGWPEDRVSPEAREAVARRDAAWHNPYFRTKVALARQAEAAVREGMDLVTALPTWVLSAWGDRGPDEPLRHAWRVARTTGFVPAVPLDVVPAPVAAAGILRAALGGAPGERYQICGVETDTHALHASSLRHLGLHPRPLRVSRRELRDELRLLSGRPRSSPWLELWLLPWDVTRRAVLREFGIEPWHLAVMLEGSGRSGEKLRRLESGPASGVNGWKLPPHPDAGEIAACLEAEARRKVLWMEADGRLAEPATGSRGSRRCAWTTTQARASSGSPGASRWKRGPR